MNLFRCHWFILLALASILAGCDDVSAKQYRFTEFPDSVVILELRDGQIIMECEFPSHKALSRPDNRNADRRTGLALAEKALAEYFALQPGEVLKHHGLEPEKLTYQLGKVRQRFRIQQSNCEKISKAEPDKDKSERIGKP